MDLHANAALSLNKRRQPARRVVEENWTLISAAAAAEVSVRTAQKWSARYRADGEAGLIDRSSAPRSCPHAIAEDRVEAIAALRRLRLTGAEIAEAMGMAETTVSGILKRIGMGRRGRLGLEPECRYERSRPGELIHVDVKKLGRIDRPGHRVTGSRSDRRNQGKEGWEFVHIAIDDATRLAYAEVLTDERAVTAIAFFRRALKFFARYGIKVERVMSAFAIDVIEHLDKIAPPDQPLRCPCPGRRRPDVVERRATFAWSRSAFPGPPLSLND